MDVKSIKVIFLDIGGVMLTNGWDHHSREKAARTFHLDYDEMNRLHTFVVHIFETKHITIDEYIDLVVFHKPRDFSRKDFKDYMYAQSTELPDLLPWLKEWKQKTALPVFALSNENAELNAYRIKKFGLHQVFDGFFSSCYLGMRKPDPHMYYKAMEICYVQPEECLYVDDRPELVSTGINLGLHAIQHQDYITTRSVLENFIKK